MFLDPNRLVTAKPGKPQLPSGQQTEDHPESLNPKPLQKLWALNFFHQHGHGEVEFIGKGEKSQQESCSAGNGIEREKSSAEEILKRIEDENDGRDLQNPES